MFITIEDAITRLRAGEFLIVVDDESEQNTGDLLLAAEHVTPERVNFMLQRAHGLVCVAMTRERLEALSLPPMPGDVPYDVTEEEHSSRKTARTTLLSSSAYSSRHRRPGRTVRR